MPVAIPGYPARAGDTYATVPRDPLTGRILVEPQDIESTAVNTGTADPFFGAGENATASPQTLGPYIQFEADPGAGEPVAGYSIVRRDRDESMRAVAYLDQPVFLTWNDMRVGAEDAFAEPGAVTPDAAYRALPEEGVAIGGAAERFPGAVIYHTVFMDLGAPGLFVSCSDATLRFRGPVTSIEIEDEIPAGFTGGGDMDGDEITARWRFASITDGRGFVMNARAVRAAIDRRPWLEREGL